MFTSLNILHLNLFDCEVLTNESAAEFGSALKSLTTLSSFSLRIHHTVQADSVIGDIAFGLSSLQNLVNLKLDFVSWMKCTPEHTIQLAESLANLTCLKFLDISFSELQSLPDDVMSKLGESLRKLTQLRHLKLKFSHMKMLTNSGVEALTDAIQELRDLLALELEFAGHEEIDKNAIEKIAQTLRHLPSLYSVRLEFLLCSKLHEKKESISSLFDALREMENIKEVTLCLPYNAFNEQKVNDLEQRKTLAINWE